MMHVYMQDPDLQGPRSATTPHLEDCTPYSDDHAACWGWQDAGAIFARPRTIPRTTATPDAIPHSVLPTVFDHCTPRDSGENDDFSVPLRMYTVPPCDYKRRRRASFEGGRFFAIILTRAQRSALDIGTRLNQLLLSSSRDLGASLPLSPRLYPLVQAPPVQDKIVPSHTPLAGHTAPRPEPG